jgi:hypothetical protein
MVIIIICKTALFEKQPSLENSSRFIWFSLLWISQFYESKGYSADILTRLHTGYGYYTGHSQLSKAQQTYTALQKLG